MIIYLFFATKIVGKRIQYNKLLVVKLDSITPPVSIVNHWCK